MWRYDFERTAESPQQLPNELALLWSRDLPKPLPAFNDVRLQFDGGYEPIVVGQRLFLSSNCEDKVTAFDTNSGAQLWQFFAAGPVRLAPVAWKGRVLFGSDDGNFYCVAADTGKLVWKVKAVPSDRKLLGNERLISVWPIRGGPVLKDDRVYFAAGVWPFEGVFIYCLDAATGKQIWVNDSTGHLYGQQPHNAVAIGGIAPQGYLLIDGDDLVVPSSNAYPGRFDLKTGEPQSETMSHSDFIFELAFSHDGELLLTAGRDGQALLWNWRENRRACPPLDHPDEVYDVALTKTGSVPKWVEVEASKLLANPKVALSIQTAMERRDGATVASSVKTREYVLEQLYKESIGADSDASRIRALELLGKTVGIFTDQIEVKSHRSTEEIDRDLEEKIVQLLADVEG